MLCYWRFKVISLIHAISLIFLNNSTNIIIHFHFIFHIHLLIESSAQVSSLNWYARICYAQCNKIENQCKKFELLWQRNGERGLSAPKSSQVKLAYGSHKKKYYKSNVSTYFFFTLLLLLLSPFCLHVCACACGSSIRGSNLATFGWQWVKAIRLSLQLRLLLFSYFSAPRSPPPPSLMWFVISIVTCHIR